MPAPAPANTASTAATPVDDAVDKGEDGAGSDSDADAPALGATQEAPVEASTEQADPVDPSSQTPHARSV